MGVLSIKRIYEPANPADGTRVLVDRLWPRGVTRDKAQVDLWLKDIAPSPALREWFGHDPSHWEEFRREYRVELANNPAPIEQVAALAEHGPVTLLYAAHDETYNHARVLIEYLRSRKEQAP